jgi:hypothetical protein
LDHALRRSSRLRKRVLELLKELKDVVAQGRSHPKVKYKSANLPSSNLFTE